MHTESYTTKNTPLSTVNEEKNIFTKKTPKAEEKPKKKKSKKKKD
jgi:hypothetical protein